MSDVSFKMNGYPIYKAVVCPPDCPERKKETEKGPQPRCTCPNRIYVPAGKHIHHWCPLHGDVIIKGNSSILEARG